MSLQADTDDRHAVYRRLNRRNRLVAILPDNLGFQ